jgi:hypothetical protein
MAKGAHRVFGIDLGLTVALVVLALLVASPLVVSRFDQPLRRQLRSRLGVTSSARAKE